jgi:hypothetical protein
LIFLAPYIEVLVIWLHIWWYKLSGKWEIKHSGHSSYAAWAPVCSCCCRAPLCVVLFIILWTIICWLIVVYKHKSWFCLWYCLLRY